MGLAVGITWICIFSITLLKLRLITPFFPCSFVIAPRVFRSVYNDKQTSTLPTHFPLLNSSSIHPSTSSHSPPSPAKPEHPRHSSHLARIYTYITSVALFISFSFHFSRQVPVYAPRVSVPFILFPPPPLLSAFLPCKYVCIISLVMFTFFLRVAVCFARGGFIRGGGGLGFGIGDWGIGGLGDWRFGIGDWGFMSI